MDETLWKILLIEDDEEDFILTRDILSEARGIKYQFEWVSTYDQGIEVLSRHPYDVILLDYELGLQSGIDLIREIRSKGIKTPVILLTGHGSYDVDLEAMKAGATDYLSKGDVTPRLLERTIRYAILRKQTEDELRAAKEELEQRVRERTYELMRKNDALVLENLERRRIENELAEVQRRLLDRAEAERRELARELHDGPMQELYGVIFAVNAPDANLDNPEEVKNRLLQVVQSLRTISRELRPPALAPYGLQKAIQSHLELVQKNHPELKIHTELTADGQILPERVRMALYRIYQNALVNVLRHAKADEIKIVFKLTRHDVILEISDNGVGFEVPDRWIEFARQGHLGLVGAHERAEAIGGRLQVESEPGHGCLVRVIAPRIRES